MFANRFASLLTDEGSNTDLAPREPADIYHRFESLRGYRLLPIGRTKNVTHLSSAQMAAAILSTVTTKPGFAGPAATMLKGLRPVGGTAASFNGCGSLGEAVGCLIENSEALASFVELRVSDSEIYTSAHGRAAIVYRRGDTLKTAYYVGQTSIVTQQAGAEQSFDPRDTISSVVTETIFYPPLFQRIYHALKREAFMPQVTPAIDPRDEEEETRKEERARRLGLSPRSRFLNYGVDNQVTWPPQETVVMFEGHRFVLMPKTAEHTTSIHIDLAAQGISAEHATSLINRFLSLLTWCDDQYAILQDGWSGNPVPVPVPKRELAFTTAHTWIFGRKVPDSPDARNALAIYREGRNAEQNYLISYAILSYFKVIEIKFKNGEGKKVQNWIVANYQTLKADKNMAREIAAFELECGGEEPQTYLNKACRVAVAHASVDHPSDPDELTELRRLHVVAHILRALARRFIAEELHVSDCSYDGS